MYKIIKTDGTELGITENVLYIGKNNNGEYVPVDIFENAIGVSYGNVVYNLAGRNEIENADTVVILKMDSGTVTAAVGVLLGGMGDIGGLAVQFRRAVQFFADTLDNTAALSVAGVYDEWKPGVDYKAGQHVRWHGNLYRVTQSHTAQADWTPDASPSLFARIDVVHAGTIDDPIPYEGNMALTSGLYYTQDGVTYRCFRDTGIAVYAALSELVGLYVEVAA